MQEINKRREVFFSYYLKCKNVKTSILYQVCSVLNLLNHGYIIPIREFIFAYLVYMHLPEFFWGWGRMGSYLKNKVK